MGGQWTLEGERLGGPVIYVAKGAQKIPTKCDELKQDKEALLLP